MAAYQPEPGAAPLGVSNRDEVIHITRGLKNAMQPDDALDYIALDYIALDYFSMADRPIDQVRWEFGIGPKSGAAVAAGSRDLLARGGINEAQVRPGRRTAEAQGLGYDPRGAHG
ncbi:MAG: hypothetical protein OEW30_17215 [Acidimicrobiia bacterium]|nr:hypothetical protein [Acidimicrobiia bacterium]